MTAPDARQSDELREALVEALRNQGFWFAPGERARVLDALLPVVTAWAEPQARARAAEELRNAAAWLARGAAGHRGPLRTVARKLDDRADALAADDRTDPA